MALRADTDALPIQEETGLPFVTEVVAPEDVDLVGAYADMLQIGARNMQNFRLLSEVGAQRKPVLLKRGISIQGSSCVSVASGLSRRQPGIRSMSAPCRSWGS